MNRRRGRPVTGRVHVPIPAPDEAGSPSEKRRSWRRRAARDARCSCLNFSTISSIASVAWRDRPARDGGAWLATKWSSRWRCWRARPSSRAAPTSASRRRHSCFRRRRSRHCFPQVICVRAVEGAGRYQQRHSQQRRRGDLGTLGFIRQRCCLHGTPATSRPGLRSAVPIGYLARL